MTVTEVNKSNFRDILPEFYRDLEQSQFIAIDTEFSGLHEMLSNQFSLFDTPACRYRKMASNRIKVVQFGIALFKFNCEGNEWHPHCYNFLIFPVAFDAVSMTEPIVCQASSLAFLRLHNFDFNMWISNGIPYLNETTASKVERYLKSRRTIFQNGSEIAKVTLSSTRKYKQNLSGSPPAILNDDDIKNIMDDLKGFSLVIEAISRSRKIIVGHNMYVDLFLTYQEFRDELPESYEEFKAEIVKVFPRIVDTKRLAHAIKDHFSTGKSQNEHSPFDVSLLGDTNLFTLHFTTQVDEKFSPKVISAGEYKSILEQAAKRRIETIPDNLCHDAAFDACVTGCVFIQLAYLIQRPSLQKQLATLYLRARSNGVCMQALFWFLLDLREQKTPEMHTGFVEMYGNKLGITEKLTNNLQGVDPPSHRPPLIIVQGHQKQGNLLSHVEKLHKDLPKFGDYDLKYHEGNIVIACGNAGCYRGVSRYLSEQKFIVKDRTKIWNRLMQHTTCVKFCGAIVVTGALVYWHLRDRS